MRFYPKRLIEVDFPFKKIPEHARREKSISHGHISTLHCEAKREERGQTLKLTYWHMLQFLLFLLMPRGLTLSFPGDNHCRGGAP
jgi:hypothetical protein